MSKLQALNIADNSRLHAETVLDAMRKAIKEVPIEHRQSAIAIVYRAIGKAHYQVK